MTPFGARLRVLREERGLTLAALAEKLQVSAAYLSALEHGHRGVPRSGLVQQVCAVFGLIWDEADELGRLARLSHPRVHVNTAGLPAAYTELANRLAQMMKLLSPDAVDRLNSVLDEEVAANRRALRMGGSRASGPNP